MDSATIAMFRAQLLDRRERLSNSLVKLADTTQVVRLLREVDLALERMNDGSYGICEACKGPIEAERLQANPLMRLCLDHLTARQQKELEDDLDLASRIQATLLPKNSVRHAGWEIYYHYEPAGLVGGDYCDIVTPESGDGLLFVLGDVSGKGLAASMLMTQLHASFHSLATFGLPLPEMMSEVNRLLCESAPMSYYATVVCGRADAQGTLQLCNAGHFPPLILRDGSAVPVDATAIPVGLFHGGEYTIRHETLKAGDTLFLYTDGLLDARNDHSDYGMHRATKAALRYHTLPVKDLVDAVVGDLKSFLAGRAKPDDLTVMAIRRTD